MTAPLLRPGSAAAELLVVLAEKVEASGRPLVYIRSGLQPVHRRALKRLTDLAYISPIGQFWLVKVAGLEAAAVLKASR